MCNTKWNLKQHTMFSLFSIEYNYSKKLNKVNKKNNTYTGVRASSNKPIFIWFEYEPDRRHVKNQFYTKFNWKCSKDWKEGPTARGAKSKARGSTIRERLVLVLSRTIIAVVPQRLNIPELALAKCFLFPQLKKTLEDGHLETVTNIQLQNVSGLYFCML